MITDQSSVISDGKNGRGGILSVMARKKGRRAMISDGEKEGTEGYDQ